MRGDRQRAALLQDETEKTAAENTEVISISTFRTKKIPPLVWRECTPRAFASLHIKKVWEVDPLLCLHCGGLMMVSFIYERKMIIKILAHFGVLKDGEAKRNRAPPVPVDTCGGTSIEPYDDGWPVYEESFVDVQTL